MSRLAVKLVGTICVKTLGKLFDKKRVYVLCEKTQKVVKIFSASQI